MKTKIIYNYDLHSGLFLGESEAYFSGGVWHIPASATDIPPPRYFFNDKHIPVFRNKKWIIVEDNIWRPSIATELNYSSGRLSLTYTPINLPYNNCFPHYPSLPMICSSSLITLEISQKLRLIQRKLNEINDFHKELSQNESILNRYQIFSLGNDLPKECNINESNLYKYHFLCEEMVSHMRTTIDRLIQLTYILTNYNDYDRSKHVKISQIGNLANNTNPITDLEKVIIGDGISYKKDTSGFLSILNDLSNSMKHSVMHAESYNLFCNDGPSIVSYQAKQNDHKKTIIYHNHVPVQLVMGFQDNLIRIIQNHREYVKRQVTHDG